MPSLQIYCLELNRLKQSLPREVQLRECRLAAASDWCLLVSYRPLAHAGFYIFCSSSVESIRTVLATCCGFGETFIRWASIPHRFLNKLCKLCTAQAARLHCLSRRICYR